ncbi:Vegetative incompatibility protein HET-E-1, partial [Serendipita indica DSM 11827]
MTTGTYWNILQMATEQSTSAMAPLWEWWTSTDEGKSKIDDLGFLELFSEENPVVDIVAIHGLNGHREKTWTSEDGKMWLRDFLQDDLPRVRVLSYGYDADTHSRERVSTETIHRHGNNLANALSRARKGASRRPIIFVAHDVGGIILKWALVISNNKDPNSDGNLRDILVSTYSILFFGTPHFGIEDPLPGTTDRLLSIPMYTTNVILKVLQPYSSELENIQKLYLEVSKKQKTYSSTRNTRLVGNLEGSWSIKTLENVLAKTSHRTFELTRQSSVRFASPESDNYQTVLFYLKEHFKKASRAVDDKWLDAMRQDPLKAVSEISHLFFEKTKTINEKTNGYKVLRDSLEAHISILDEGYLQTVEDGHMDQMPDALKEFNDAWKHYMVTLRNILTRMDELKRSRDQGVKGFIEKIKGAKIDTGDIADYKQEILQATRICKDVANFCQNQLQAEVWKVAQLEPEKPRPMGTQHKTCLPGTRVAILREIRQWRLDPNADKRIFWLCDVGGSGKSTVTLTMCEEWDNTENVLVGRFFFSKNARQTSETDDFCSVIAGDIGGQNKTILKQIETIRKEDPNLLIRGLRHQFTKLIEEPLQLARTDIVLVIDAMDECKKETRGELIKLLVEKLSSMPKLKLFITSRPEPDITAILQGKAIVRGMHFKMHGKEQQSNLDDIRAYVDVHLVNLLTEPQRWKIVERSNGLFIWITTAHLELQQAQGPAAVGATLTSLLTRGEGGDINQVYTNILRRLRREPSSGTIHKVMGTILTLFEPVSTEALEEMTGIADSELRLILGSMQSVFRVESVVEFLHPTFREYLLSPYNVDIPFDSTAMQSDLALSVLTVLQRDLKEDVCGISMPNEPYPRNTDVMDLDKRLERLWTSCPALPYAAKYWGYHVSTVITEKQVAQMLQRFLENQILYLVELLSLMDHVHLIRNFEEIRRSCECQGLGDEVELCHDTVRLVQRHQKILEKSALDIYSSGLLFLPRKSQLWTIYKSKFSDRLPRIIGGPSVHWPSHQTLTGHTNTVQCLAFLPDGRRLASGSWDGTVRLWDGTTGASLGTLEGHTGPVQCLAFLPDGRRLASGSWDGTVRLWDGTTGASLGTLEGHTGPVQCLAFSPDGRRLASGSWDGTVRLWDGTTGASLGTLEGHTREVQCLAFSPDGRRLASGSRDGTVRLWDGTTGASLGTLEGHTREVWCLAFSPDGRRLASGSEDHTVCLWDGTTGASLGTLEGHTDGVLCLAFSPDGRRLASGARDGTVCLWDGTTGASLGTLEGHTDEVSCLAFSPDGRRLASGSEDHIVCLWDGTTGASLGTLEGHTDGVLCLAFSPDGRRLASGAYDHTVRLWEDHRWAPLASGSGDCTVRLWDGTTGASLGTLEGHTGPVRCLAFSPDGRRLASGSGDRTVRLWDGTTGASLGTLEGHTRDVSCLAFSPDGRRLASGSEDGTVRLWDGTTGASLGTLEGHRGPAQCLAFSPDGRRLASGSGDCTLRLWDGTTGASLGTLKGHTDSVQCLAFSPDGRRLASGSWDCTVRLWDITTPPSLEPPYALNHAPRHLYFFQ